MSSNSTFLQNYHIHFNDAIPSSLRTNIIGQIKKNHIIIIFGEMLCNPSSGWLRG